MSFTADFQTGLRLALRSRYIAISFWLLVALAIITILSAKFSGRQPATVALDVGLSMIRLALPLLMVLFSQEFFTQEFARRHYLSSLTYPRARYKFLLGRLLSLIVLGTVLLVAMGGLLAVIVELISQGYAQSRPVSLGTQYLVTLLFVLIDMFVITAAATLFAITAVTPSFVLIGAVGFMIISRSYAGMLDLLSRELVVDNPEQYRQYLGILRYILPDLGSMDVRMIALYDTFRFMPDNWPTLVTSNLIYGLILLALSSWFLQRKQFN